MNHLITMQIPSWPHLMPGPRSIFAKLLRLSDTKAYCHRVRHELSHPHSFLRALPGAWTLPHSSTELTLLSNIPFSVMNGTRVLPSFPSLPRSSLSGYGSFAFTVCEQGPCLGSTFDPQYLSKLC